MQNHFKIPIFLLYLNYLYYESTFPILVVLFQELYFTTQSKHQLACISLLFAKHRQLALGNSQAVEFQQHQLNFV